MGGYGRPLTITPAAIVKYERRVLKTAVYSCKMVVALSPKMLE